MKYAFHILFVALCLQLAGGVANAAPVYSFQYVPFNAFSLNDLGQVAGLQLADANHGLYQPLLFSNGVVTPLASNLTTSVISSLNNVGQAVDHAGIYQNGTYTFTYPGFYPGVINDAGTIVGVDARNHAALYRDGNITVLDSSFSIAGLTLNQQGEIAGAYYIGGPVGGEGAPFIHALIYSGADTCSAPTSFLYQNGVTTALPGFRGVVGINDAGQILGARGVSSSRTAILQDGDAIYDVASLIQGAIPSQTAISPRRLNNADQILAYGTINGQEGSFLLTPVPASTVPEPLSSGLLGLGFACLVIAGKVFPCKHLTE